MTTFGMNFPASLWLRPAWTDFGKEAQLLFTLVFTNTIVATDRSFLSAVSPAVLQGPHVEPGSV